MPPLSLAHTSCVRHPGREPACKKALQLSVSVPWPSGAPCPSVVHIVKDARDIKDARDVRDEDIFRCKVKEIPA